MNIDINKFKESELTLQYEVLAQIFRAKKLWATQISFEDGTYVYSKKKFEIAVNCSANKNFYFLRAMTATRKAAKILVKNKLLEVDVENLSFRELKRLYYTLEPMVSEDTCLYNIN